METEKGELEDKVRTKRDEARTKSEAARSTLREAEALSLKFLKEAFGAQRLAIAKGAVADVGAVQGFVITLENLRLTSNLGKDVLAIVYAHRKDSHGAFAANVAVEVHNAILAEFRRQNATIPNGATNNEIVNLLQLAFAVDAAELKEWVQLSVNWNGLRVQYALFDERARKAQQEYDKNANLLFSKRLLEQFMDEQEEKSVELLEALRSHASNVDNYLKRLAIAVEDDVNAQFYDPAFQHIRRASRSWDVNLGQVETTTVLTNNRTLAKVSPAATMEFNLPRRDILLTEAFKGSKALMVEYGNLMQQGTFLAGTSMLAGAPATGLVGGASPLQGIPGRPTGDRQEFGAELQKLIPEPEIYKFETGTGFEIRPVIQPDGHSIVYTFDYMYTTNVREPVRADEKHLGRVKRHFVHTDVQTSSYELREVSRYTVALNDVCSWPPSHRANFGRDRGDRSMSPALRPAI